MPCRKSRCASESMASQARRRCFPLSGTGEIPYGHWVQFGVEPSGWPVAGAGAQGGREEADKGGLPWHFNVTVPHSHSCLCFVLLYDTVSCHMAVSAL